LSSNRISRDPVAERKRAAAIDFNKVIMCGSGTCRRVFLQDHPGWRRAGIGGIPAADPGRLAGVGHTCGGAASGPPAFARAGSPKRNKGCSVLRRDCVRLRPNFISPATLGSAQRSRVVASCCHCRTPAIFGRDSETWSEGICGPVFLWAEKDKKTPQKNLPSMTGMWFHLKQPVPQSPELIANPHVNPSLHRALISPGLGG